MNNTELYINGKLVDAGGDLGVRLNRKLIDPGALNTVDAQFSYTISLPPTQVNVKAFDYANVEETRDKFNRVYTAELIINSVRIFMGLLRLTSITDSGFKGQLYLPAKKTVKEIFGELKLNENLPLRIPFLNFAEYVNMYNLAAADVPQAAIFPYVMYGVLPKLPLNRNANLYSARNLWDDSVRIGIQDLPPAINPLIMLRHIFSSRGYTLQGTAFQDDKLSQLYQTYKNAPDYVQPWNYGYHGKMRVRGSWSSRYNARTGGEQLERGVNQSSDQTGPIYSCDLFDATNTAMEVVEDNGGNVLRKEIDGGDGITWLSGQMRIPTSGLYKVQFNSSLRIYNSTAWRTTDPATGVQHVGGVTQNANNDFNNNVYGMRIVRDRNAGDFGIAGAKLDGSFYYENQPQNNIFNGENTPKYFPQFSADGQLTFVDGAQDANILMGFEFGRNEPPHPDFTNPRAGSAVNAQMLVAKPATSWDTAVGNDNLTRLAVKSPGYWKYGRIGNFDNEGDNPNINIDYSAAARITGKVLDVDGNAVSPLGGNFDTRIAGYYISAITGFQTPDVLYQVTDFIGVAGFTNLRFSAEITGLDNLQILAFYDLNMQFIGGGVTSATGDDETFTDQLITLPPGAEYFRISGNASSTIDVTADNLEDGNIILDRLPIERYYTYVLQAPPGSNYQGIAFVHNGSDTVPTLRVPFVNGVAQFDTSLAPLLVFEPRLTIYLKRPTFDVDNTLTISRRIENGSQDVIDWELTDKYKIDLNNAPANFAKRGQFAGGGADANWNAEGAASTVVWLDAGELISIASVSSEGRYRQNNMHSTFGWVSHEIQYDLTIEPFRVEIEWLKVDLRGNGTAAMNWNDPTTFDVDNINLVGFLSADMKTDEYIDNFCKAFNLGLTQVNATTFSLDVKQSKTAISNLFIDLDSVAGVKQRENTALGLPSEYVLGFTIDPEEEGFVASQDATILDPKARIASGETGGGKFSTGATEENIITQTSTFSYNWYKAINKVETGGNIVINLPIVSKAEAWDPLVTYPDAMKKRYTDLAQRFMYYAGILPGTYMYNNIELKIANVSNELPGSSILNYKNKVHTILDNYFTLLINGASHYTNIKAKITPVQYAQLDGALSVKFNGDIYYAAELTGYDPYNRNETTIKLIRKI